MASNAVAVPIVKAAAFACGDTALQREAVFAVGGNEWQAADGLQGGLRHSFVVIRFKG